MDDRRGAISKDLIRRVRRVRGQLRRRLWLACLARFGAATLALGAIATLMLAISVRIDYPKVGVFGLFALAEAVAFWRLVVSPLRRRMSLEDVALFVDENHPELENRIVTAVELAQSGEAQGSPWLIEKFLDQSLGLVRRAPALSPVRFGSTLRLLAAASLLWIVCAGLFLVSRSLWIPEWNLAPGGAAPGTVSADFTVEPGNARVRVGENQVVLVKSELTGRKATILWREAEEPWQSAAMGAGTSPGIHFHSFAAIERDIEYQVQFAGAKSPVYKIETWLPPEVVSLGAKYSYPEYLGMKPREVPNSGNLTAVEGTAVELGVEVNKKLASAEMVLASGTRLPLEETADNRWRAKFDLAENDKYHIELTDQAGAKSEYNPEYDITAEPDKAPQVRIEFPRGDGEVTSLDEVPFTFKVTDDFGIKDYGVTYQISGQEPVSTTLAGGGEGPPPGETRAIEAAAAHELALEEMKLAPGDLITWTVWAKDFKPSRGEFEEVGDPFFLEVRPFKRRFEEAVSDQGGGGMMGGGGGGEAGEQKDIVIAIWNLRREAADLTGDEFFKRRGAIADAQTKLLSGLEAATPRGDEAAKKLQAVAADMAETIKSLQEAAQPEPGAQLAAALSAAQRAYRGLLKLQSGDFQVQQNQSGGGGGGGSQRQPSEIEELEMDRNRNFYEDEKRTQAQEQAAEETLSSIKELAQRQQLVNEEIAKLISEIEQAKTEEEKRELERRLEKLREEERKNLERLDEIQRDVARSEMESEQARQTRESLDEARKQMNRSLENLEEDRLQEARSAGARASSSLGDAEEKLEKLSRGAAAERMAELREKMDQLTKQEEEILAGIESIREEHESPDLSTTTESEKMKADVLQKKDELAGGFTDLMNEASELSERAQQTQELMSRKLGDWLRETSRKGILEDIEEGESLVRYGIWDSAKEHEEGVREKLKDAAAGLASAGEKAIESDLEGMQKALDQLESIARGGEPDSEKQLADAADAGRARAPGQEKAGQESSGERNSREGRGERSQNGERSMEINEDGSPAGERERGRAEREGREPGEREGQSPGEEEARGDQPGERGEEPGDQPGEQPGGDQPGDQQGRGHGNRPGEQPGDQPGDQAGNQPGDQPGEREGQQPGQGRQPGNQPGQSQSPSESGQPGAQESPQGTEPSMQRGSSGRTLGQDPNDGQSATADAGGNGGRGGSQWGGLTRERTPFEMRRFAESEYQDWVERLRNAEALLPADSPLRPQLELVRQNIQQMREWYKRHSLAPKYEMFLGEIAQPLAAAGAELESEIRKLMKDREFTLTDEGSVPPAYRKRVAEYFRALAEAEETR